MGSSESTQTTPPWYDPISQVRAVFGGVPKTAATFLQGVLVAITDNDVTTREETYESYQAIVIIPIIIVALLLFLRAIGRFESTQSPKATVTGQKGCQQKLEDNERIAVELKITQIVEAAVQALERKMDEKINQIARRALEKVQKMEMTLRDNQDKHEIATREMQRRILYVERLTDELNVKHDKEMLKLKDQVQASASTMTRMHLLEIRVKDLEGTVSKALETVFPGVEALLCQMEGANAAQEKPSRQTAGEAGLRQAARRGRTDEVLALVEGGVQVNASDEEGVSALHLAAHGGHLSTLAALITAEADLDSEEEVVGCTPLLWAAAADQDGCESLPAGSGARLHSHEPHVSAQSGRAGAAGAPGQPRGRKCRRAQPQLVLAGDHMPHVQQMPRARAYDGQGERKAARRGKNRPRGTARLGKVSFTRRDHSSFQPQ